MPSLLSLRTLEWFVAFAMCLLGLQKLKDLESFSNMFLNYDLLAQRKVRYAYVYPFAETWACGCRCGCTCCSSDTLYQRPCLLLAEMAHCITRRADRPWIRTEMMTTASTSAHTVIAPGNSAWKTA